MLTATALNHLKDFLLSDSTHQKKERLFQRLHHFYLNWCEGLYIENASSENWPKHKVVQMKAVGVQIGLIQVDIYAGLNVIILLFKLHFYSQREESQDKDVLSGFNPCGDPSTEDFDCDKLLRIISYSRTASPNLFRDTVGCHLAGADLRKANLCGVDLMGVDLSYANLESTDLSRADLNKANLSEANLSLANLRHANVRRAKLYKANLKGADLSKSDLVFSDFSHADLSNADLHLAYLRRANLSDANLYKLRLTCATLSYSDLSRANLAKANLNFADMSGVKVRFANLEDILSNQETVWTGIKYVKTAKNLPHFLRNQFGIS